MRLLAFAVALLLCGSARAQNARADLAAIARLERERVTALLKNDGARLQKMLAPEFVMTDNSGDTRTGAQYVSSLQKREFGFAGYVLESNTTRFYGTAALVAGTYRAQSNRAKSRPYRARHLRVYAKRNGAWKLVAHQATKINSETR